MPKQGLSFKQNLNKDKFLTQVYQEFYFVNENFGTVKSDSFSAMYSQRKLANKDQNTEGRKAKDEKM